MLHVDFKKYTIESRSTTYSLEIRMTRFELLCIGPMCVVGSVGVRIVLD